jgi:hypothetical protein
MHAKHAMRPIEIVIKTVFYEEGVELSLLVGIGGELFIAIFVDAVTPFNPAVEVRASGGDTAMPYPMLVESALHGREGVGFGLRQLVVDKLQTIVGLDAVESESRSKEPGSVL